MEDRKAKAEAKLLEDEGALLEEMNEEGRKKVSRTSPDVMVS